MLLRNRRDLHLIALIPVYLLLTIPLDCFVYFFLQVSVKAHRLSVVSEKTSLGVFLFLIHAPFATKPGKESKTMQVTQGHVNILFLSGKKKNLLKFNFIN